MGLTLGWRFRLPASRMARSQNRVPRRSHHKSAQPRFVSASQTNWLRGPSVIGCVRSTATPAIGKAATPTSVGKQTHPLALTASQATPNPKPTEPGRLSPDSLALSLAGACPRQPVQLVDRSASHRHLTPFMRPEPEPYSQRQRADQDRARIPRGRLCHDHRQQSDGQLATAA